MVFTKLLLENALAIRPCNCEAALEPLLPKVARCIPVLPSRYKGKCAARVLKRSGLMHQSIPSANMPPPPPPPEQAPGFSALVQGFVKSVQSALSDLLTTSATHGTFSRPSTKRGLISIIKLMQFTIVRFF